MKKLLLVGSNSVHTYNYLELIASYFDEILIITNEKREGTDFNAIELDFRLKLSSFFVTVRKIREICDDFHPSVIHVHQANSFAFFSLLAARKDNVPTILTAWGSDILLLPSKGVLMKKMVQFNLGHADYYTSDSKFMAEEMVRLNPAVKNVLIANFGIALIPVDTPKENIIYSNRLHKKLYRVDKVIESFARFIKLSSDKSWKLVIAGKGEDTPFLEKLADDLQLGDKIEFVGWVDKQTNAQWYSCSKLWISIPESDATAISLLEAMAYGCIPVVSDLPANREWITDGMNGLIVKDIEGDYISEALQINAENAIVLNNERVNIDGTKEANKKKFIALYDSILNK